MNMLRHLALLLLMACWADSAQGQTTWYVDDDCAPPGLGAEVDPFCTIQMGVEAASDGDTVLVQPGTYTGAGNRDISLFGKTIVLKSAEGPTLTVMDIEGSPSSIHRGFFLIHGETLDTIIEGFTIINGYLIGDTGGTGSAGGGGGAGIYLRQSSPTIRHCVVRENVSATLGAPFVKDGRGGGIYVDGLSAAVLGDCVVASNTSEKRGGGLYVGYADTTLTINNCVITGNTSGIGGGGIHNTFGGTIISGTTFVDNIGSTGGGIHNEGGVPFLSNCILWSNQAVFGSEIFVQGPVLTIEYSDVEGGLDEVDGCCNEEIDWGPGMIDADPLFSNPENNDYHLLHGSPCIDAGDNLAVPEGVTTDLDGDPRFLDDPDTPDTGNPDPDRPKLPIVDMGPDEFDHLDCNNNDVPDEQDIADGTSTDVDRNGLPDECQPDCNDNDIPDSHDIFLGDSTDCDDNGVPDECDPDCNANGVPDACDIADGTSNDCDGDGIPDECEDGPGPVITAQPISQEVEPGDFVIFGVLADGILLEYQWRKDGVDLADTERIFGTNTSGLFIFLVIPEDAGSYDCVVTDFFGACATSNVAVLTVTDPCPADFDDDGTVGASDLAMLLGNWGPCDEPCTPGDPAQTCAADLSGDCTVEAFDLAQLLGHWGPCE